MKPSTGTVILPEPGYLLAVILRFSKKLVWFSQAHMNGHLFFARKPPDNPNTGIITYGDDLLRKPTSLQVNVDFRQPVVTELGLSYKFQYI